MRDRLMFGPAADVARDVLDELERRPADVIVTEVMLAGALVAGEAAGVFGGADHDDRRRHAGARGRPFGGG